MASCNNSPVYTAPNNQAQPRTNREAGWSPAEAPQIALVLRIGLSAFVDYFAKYVRHAMRQQVGAAAFVQGVGDGVAVHCSRQAGWDAIRCLPHPASCRDGHLRPLDRSRNRCVPVRTHNAQGSGLVFTTSVRHEVDARDTKGGQRAAMHGGHVPMNSALTFPSFAAGPRPPHKLRGVPQCWRNSNVTR